MNFDWIKQLFKKHKISLAHDSSTDKLNSDIAIIGMACRFPDANDYHKFWENLLNNVNSIKEIPPDRWDVKKYYSPERNAFNKSISKWGGLLDQIDSFDAPFFHISPREAAAMDPQQRLLLEETWHCVEDSGARLKALQKSKTSVFVGVMAIDYQHHLFDQNHITDSYECLGNYEGILANRISYFFNFTGESQSIDTACASSLVALHDARRSLLSGESDYAIAAGVSVICHPWRYISFSQSHMLSPDGQCKTFDAEANGYVPGEGVGVLLLCPLQKAIEKKYHIHGVLKGSAVKHTGKSNSITAPRVEIECQVIEEAISSSGIPAEQITYVEAHGTGTSLGDPIEVEALTHAFHTNKKQYCYIGSVKTNIGHLEAAAGVASVIKVLLMMQHRKIPKTINIKTVNTIIDFENSPFMVADRLYDWRLPDFISRRYSGVSSFGFGGVNAHVILEEYTHTDTTKDPVHDFLPFILSAKTANSLYQLIRNWQEYVKTDDFNSQSLENICYTLMQGRAAFPFRFGVIIKNKIDLINALENVNDHIAHNFFNTQDELIKKSITLRLWNIFDLNYINFRNQCQKFTTLKLLIDECENKICKIKNGKKILKKIHHENGSQSQLIKKIIVHYILSKSLINSGLHPQYIVDHGAGEFDEAVIGGMLDFGTAIQWLFDKKNKVTLRRPAIALYDIHQNKMIPPYKISIKYCRFITKNLDIDYDVKNKILIKAKQLNLNQHTFKKYFDQWREIFSKHNVILEEDISNVSLLETNSQHLVFIALILCFKKLNSKWHLSDKINLNNEHVIEIVDLLLDKVINHEHAADLILNKNDETYKKIAIHIQKNESKLDPNKPYTLLKKLNYTLREISDPSAWMESVLHEDILHEDIKNIDLEEKYYKNPLYIDIGDHHKLKINNLDETLPYFLIDLWNSGVSINWKLWYSFKQCHKVTLPVYPFTKERHWIYEPDKEKSLESESYALKQNQTCVILEKNWKLSNSIIEKSLSYSFSGKIIFLVNSTAKSLAEEFCLTENSFSPIYIHQSNMYQCLSSNEYTMAFDKAEDGEKIANEILENNKNVIGIIDLSDIQLNPVNYCPPIYGKITLLQELLKFAEKNPFHVLHITKELQAFKTKKPDLAGANFAGLIKLLNREYSNVYAKTIDIDGINSQLFRQIIYDELMNPNNDNEICYRNGQRYVPYMHALQEKHQTGNLHINPEQVYVITGGTRGIGALMARYLVKHGARKLVLMGLQALPPRIDWDAILTGQNSHENIIAKIKFILELEKFGVVVEVYSGPLTDKNSLTLFFNRIRYQLGTIGGVIHCAGLINNKDPAFIHKDIHTFQSVCEPKITGLQILHTIFEHDCLSFFLLFSSISGVIPTLGVGLSDYAMANAFMDFFAAYQVNNGNTYYRSIQWASWKEVGMGEMKSATYQKLGLLTQSNQQGLHLLESTLAWKGQPCLMPCVVDVNLFNSNTLLENTKKIELIKPVSLSVESTSMKSTSKNIEWLIDLFSQEVKLPKEKLDENKSFDQFGVDSILLATIVKKMEERLDIFLDPSLLLEYPTLSSLSQHLDQMHHDKLAKITQKIPFDEPQSKAQQFSSSSINSDNCIAVIGMACHFPGAKDKTEFWQNLSAGKNSISEVPASRWDVNRFYSPYHQPGKTVSKWGGFIKGIKAFDPDYFGITEFDAPYIDPLVRQFLEVSAQTLRDAGYQNEELSNKKVGVFVGSRVANYGDRVQLPHKNTITGIGQNFIAAHVSHVFNFNGPNLVIDSACSSSLVSIHLACQSLLMGESEYALAGGVDILLDEKLYLILSEAKALSPDGQCHTFDEKANGFVPGEGCGAILLKPLAKAIADHDHIYAVIEASAVNNDGHTMGITTPNPAAQQAVVEEAIKKANVDVSTISYIETHGTGTMIGDPMELKALTTVFRKKTENTQFCAVGSVKSNIGHLLSAAGIASFIKVALCLYHKQFVPTLNCETPNPRFDFIHSPFYPNTLLKPWEPVENIRRAGISSFGFGGTNAHFILREMINNLVTNEQRKPLPPVVFHRKKYWLDTPLSHRIDTTEENIYESKHEDNFLVEIVNDNNDSSFDSFFEKKVVLRKS